MRLVAVLAALAGAVALAQIDVSQDGVYRGRARNSVDCRGTGASCTVQDGGYLRITASTSSLADGGIGFVVPPVCQVGSQNFLGWDGGAWQCGAITPSTSLPVPPVCDGGTGGYLGWDGGAWACFLPASSSGKSILSAYFSTVQNTNLTKSDHLKFNAVEISNGSDITLDTSTTYTSQNNVASIGRFTLAGSKTYRASFTPGYITYSTANAQALLAFYNATNGTPIGSVGISESITQAGGNVSGAGVIEALFTTAGSTLFEVRVVDQVSFASVGSISVSPDGGSIPAGPHMTIEVLY